MTVRWRRSKEVVEHYDRGGVDRPSRSDLMKPLGLTAQEKADLVAFLKTLTSDLSPTSRAGSAALTRPANAKDFPCATALLTIVIIAGLSAGAFAATQVIHQQGRMFSAESITIKKGEALTFLNDDSVPHNIMSASKGNEFNLGSQSPGRSTDVTFKEAGECR